MSYHLKGGSATRKRIYVRDMGVCGRCGKYVAWDDYDVGHIYPRAMGGGDHDGNLRVEHKRCNRRAGQAQRQPGVRGLPWASPSRW